MQIKPMKCVKYFIGLLISLFVFAQHSVLGQEKPEIKVGALLSLSGGLEQWCGYLRQGIELAASEESAVIINVLFEDDRSVDKKTTLTAAQKFLQFDKVDLLYSWTASSAPVLIPVATKAQTPFLIGAYDSNVANGGPYVFGAFVNYERVAREIAQFFVKEKGAHRLGIIIAAEEWSQNFENPFRDEIQKLGATVVFSETIAPNEKETRSLVLKLKNEKVDAVLAPLFSLSLYSFVKEARDLHFNGIIHVADGMFEEDIKTIGAAAEGIYAAQIWLESDEFLAAVRQRFKSTPNPLQLGLIATGYDWVKHLQGAGAHILQSGKKISRETLKDELRNFQSVGYLGAQMYGAPPLQSGERTMIVQDGHYIIASPESHS